MNGESSEQAIPRRNRTRRLLIQAALGIAILLSGFVMGSGVTLLALKGIVRESLDHPDQVAERAAARLGRHYDLEANAEAEARRIFQARLENLAEIRREAYPEVNRELESMRDEIADLMDKPEDAKRWKKRFDQFQRRIQPPPPANDP